MTTTASPPLACGARQKRLLKNSQAQPRGPCNGSTPRTTPNSGWRSTWPNAGRNAHIAMLWESATLQNDLPADDVEALPVALGSTLKSAASLADSWRMVSTSSNLLWRSRGYVRRRSHSARPLAASIRPSWRRVHAAAGRRRERMAILAVASEREQLLATAVTDDSRSCMRRPCRSSGRWAPCHTTRHGQARDSRAPECGRARIDRNGD